MILFDLDGTLLDTAPDLALALNLQRQRYGLEALPLEAIRPYASHGSTGLLSVGFGLTQKHADFSAMREEYLNLYDEVFTRSPILFDGVAELLLSIENRGLRWGIVTNKPKRFTDPLLKVMQLAHRASCVVSGDDSPRAKPYPDTLFLACEQAVIAPVDCIYVGDAERDIQAGIAAGMRTVVALYGYIGSEDEPQAWGADWMVAQPLEVLALI